MTVTELESPELPKEVDYASIKQLHRAWLLNLEEAYEAEVVKALRRSLRKASTQLGNLTAQGEPAGEPYISMDDLQAIAATWGEEVAENLLPKLTDVMLAGAQGTGLSVAGSARVVADAIESPAVQYLSAANNRLVGIGDDAWGAVREQLVEGMQAGEGIPDLKRRVRESLGVVESRARMIARTEVIGASNAGAYFQAKAANAEVKIWLTTDDSRTRPTHSSADGQKVGIDEFFTVGGASMRYPHDPAGPAGETINCRCTTLYDEESLCVCTPSWVTRAEGALVAAGEPDCACSGVVEEEALTAASEPHTSGMIALLPETPITIEGGEPPEESHLTLWFLGDAAEIPPSLQQEILGAVEHEMRGLPPVEAEAFGVAVWNPNGDDPCVVLNVGGDGLRIMREATDRALAVVEDSSAGASWEVPAQYSPWAAHLCLVYDDDPQTFISAALEQIGPVTFDRVQVAFGDVAYDFPLGG